MATIKHKRNSVKGDDGVPSTGDLVLGELALNTNTGIIYLKTEDSAGNEAIIDFQQFKIYDSAGTRIN